MRARYRVRISQPTTSFNEGLNNNVALVWSRKNEKGVIVQHSELVTNVCNQPGCNVKICISLCGKK